MKKPITKLKKFLQKGYRITDSFYYWSEDDEPYAHIVLEKSEGKLQYFIVEGDEVFEFIVHVNEILKKMIKNKKLGS